MKLKHSNFDRAFFTFWTFLWLRELHTVGPHEVFWAWFCLFVCGATTLAAIAAWVEVKP